DLKKDGLPRAYDADLDAKTLFYLRGDDRTPDKDRKIVPGVPEALGGTFKVEPVKLPPTAYNPDKREFVIRETVAAAEAAVTKARAARGPAQQQAKLAAATVAAVPEVLPAIARLGAGSKALDAGALARLEADAAEANRVALSAVLRAERLEDAGQRGSEEWKQAA